MMEEIYFKDIAENLIVYLDRDGINLIPYLRKLQLTDANNQKLFINYVDILENFVSKATDSTSLLDDQEKDDLHHIIYFLEQNKLDIGKSIEKETNVRKQESRTKLGEVFMKICSKLPDDQTIELLEFKWRLSAKQEDAEMRNIKEKIREIENIKQPKIDRAIDDFRKNFRMIAFIDHKIQMFIEYSLHDYKSYLLLKQSETLNNTSLNDIGLESETVNSDCSFNHLNKKTEPFDPYIARVFNDLEEAIQQLEKHGDRLASYIGKKAKKGQVIQDLAKKLQEKSNLLKTAYTNLNQQDIQKRHNEFMDALHSKDSILNSHRHLFKSCLVMIANIALAATLIGIPLLAIQRKRNGSWFFQKTTSAQKRNQIKKAATFLENSLKNKIIKPH